MADRTSAVDTPAMPLRLLLINPNTSAHITDLVVEAARAVAGPDTQIVGVTGRFGARYIASRAAYAIAGHAALDAYAAEAGTADGVLLACFGDPGLEGLKEVARQPVVGLAEASCQAALAQCDRFAIVTGGDRWRGMLEEFIAVRGWSGSLACVETVAPDGAAIARDPDAASRLLADACRRCVERDGAKVVIMGGAGLAGMAQRIAGDVPVPVIDSITAGVRRVEALALAARTGARATAPQTLPVATVGLSDELARVFRP